MARAPVPGRCKTRLGAVIGAERACDLYRAMLLDTLGAIETAFDARLVVLAAPEDDGVAALSRLLPARWEVVAQRGDGLGERLANGLSDLGARGGAVALVDSDSPTAPWADAARAFDALGGRRVLLGPCDDGGYWLIAATEPERRLFEGIAWSTPRVARETRARCAELGLACVDLPAAYDVDGARDVDRLRAELARDPGRAPRTRAALGPPRVVAVVPALDEEDSIGDVVRGVAPFVDAVVVVDNGSADRTADRARAAGATVEREGRRGYGAACLAGVRRARELGAGVVLFLDGDGSDDPSEAPLLLEPVARGEADLVLGVRTAASTEPGAMAPVQRFGNWLAPRLMRAVVGARYRDMPPFKAVTMDALERLDLCDPGMGYIIEMLLKAHTEGLRVRELEVRCRARRAGRSKISGTVRGTLRASAKITSAILRHAVVQRLSKNPWRDAASRSDA
jgi:rSAM/selenodomain-associated transferase 1